MNELDKLRKMLDDAKIPYGSYQEIWDERPSNWFGEAGEYKRNQVIYGDYGKGEWKIDGICQWGSYGAEEGLIETYSDETGNPMVMTAQTAFDIIKKDWRRRKSNDRL